ncbi:MAG: hypothetical protein ABI877_02475 [Gemmatimonadaceae bacterium]
MPWNDERTTALVRRATELRQRQLADTGLVSYAATAHGYLTFLAQVGDGFPDPPKIVKADELALEVYWRAPNYSKQWIVGRRDTLLLPTDINYHRDHLGIVQNNFANIIRLGDGDEVRDVPHPMSGIGMAVYDYRISDSLRFDLPGRSMDVYEIKVRPKDDRVAAAVGAVYVSREDAQIVRMAFSFTRAALRDKYLEDVSIVLDNALQEARFWLPRRQEIEIRRTGTWMDFPARGIIRGRWEICCYKVNQPLPVEASIPGPEIVLAPEERRRDFVWHGGLLDSLPPDVRAATDEDVVRIQAEARAMVRAGALARAQSTTLAARRVSDIARITRAEGLALGTGVRHRVGHGVAIDASARFGFADHEPKGTLGLSWERPGGATLRIAAYRDYLDARDFAEASSIVNSFAAQEFGTDYTEPYDARGMAISATRRNAGRLQWRGALEVIRTDSVQVAARPVRGTYAPTIPALRGRLARFSLGLQRSTTPWIAGSEVRATVDLRGERVTPDEGAEVMLGRLWGSVEIERALGASRLALRTAGGVVWGPESIPAQDLFFAGGPTSAPGYASDRFAAKRFFSQRVEWHVPIPAPAFSLGRWGRAPARATLVPFVHVLGVGQGSAFRRPAEGLYPSVGVGLLPAFDLVRVDLSRSLRDGQWGFSIDIARDFWRIL